MSWVTGIKQVTTFQPERDGKQAIPKPVRVVSSLLPHAIERTLQPRTVLPEDTGAGPCGTLARGMPSTLRNFRWIINGHFVPSPLVWSVTHLVEPLQAWYEKQNRPRDPLSRSGLPHGARSGGGNGRVTLW